MKTTASMRRAMPAASALAFAISFFSGPAQAETDAVSLTRPDGSRIDWSIDLPETGETHGIIVLAQGSGCEPVVQSANIRLARAAFPDFAALTVEKYGIAPDAEIADPFGSCPAAYHAHNTASQRTADYLQVLQALKSAPWWNGELVLFGGSMGGSVMARLAPEVHPDAAILLSTGGGTTFGDMVLETIPEEAHPQVERQFDDIRRHPDSTELWAGSSYRFWADSLDRREVDDMLKTSASLLLIQGGNDTSSPVGVARAAADLFAERGRCNLTYWELPGLDHAMTDANGQSHLNGILDRAAGWLAMTLDEVQVAPCALPE